MNTIYFATNRNPNHPTSPNDFGNSFSSNGLADLRFGSAKVQQGKLTQIQVLPDSPELGSKALLSALQADMKNVQKDTLVFIHGFNVSFREALESAGQMLDFYRTLSKGSYDPNIFVFSWPSDGQLNHYQHDRHDAETSGYAFARGLLKLHAFLRETDRQFACDRKINLMAHSMGNYVLRHALQQFRKASGLSHLPRCFDNIILTAADEDSDAFEHEHKLARLSDIGQRVTVYFNNQDLALKVSDHTKGNPDRLGHDGPNKPHQINGKLVLVDASDVIQLPDYHSYHQENAQVALDMIAVLQGHSSESKTFKRKYVPHANKFRLI